MARTGEDKGSTRRTVLTDEVRSTKSENWEGGNTNITKDGIGRVNMGGRPVGTSRRRLLRGAPEWMFRPGEISDHDRYMKNDL